MELKPAFNLLKNSENFSKWIKSNKRTYFSFAFKIPQEMQGWHLGFYNKEKDRVTTFVINETSIEIKKEEEIFKKEESQVKELKIDNLKLTFEQVLEKAKEFQAQNYPKDNPIKTIAILQNSTGTDIWNITYISQAFNTLNMKIKASDGDIVEHKISSIFSFRQS